MNDATGGLEAALEAAENEVGNAAKVTATLGRELKKARAAAATGQVRELRRVLESAAALAAQVADQLGAVSASYALDDHDLLASGAYVEELLDAAKAAGVAMFTDDDRLLCYPSIVRVLAGDLALEVDRKRIRTIRPSAVVAQLGKAQRAGPRFRPEPFLASLLGAYDHVAARQGKGPGSVVRLQDIYHVLTLLPGQAREYTTAEFARDLYLLDQTGAVAVAGGRRLRWAASSGTRQAGMLTTVTRGGQQQRYWGVAFDDAPAQWANGSNAPAEP